MKGKYFDFIYIVIVINSTSQYFQNNQMLTTNLHFVNKHLTLVIT